MSKIKDATGVSDIQVQIIPLWEYFNDDINFW